MVGNTMLNAQHLKDELKEKFRYLILVSLAKCPKARAKIDLRENVQPVFKIKKKYPICLSRKNK